MAPLPGVILNSTFYLYPSPEEAETASQRGGTCFNLCVPIEGHRTALMAYVVTAAHVVMDLPSSPPARTVRMNHPTRQFSIFEIPEEDWFFHDGGDDVAAAVIPPHAGLISGALLPSGLCLTRERYKAEEIGVGDSVYMVGRLLLAEGKEMNTPAVRFGHISMDSAEPVYVDGMDREQESLLVEVHSASGFSGSPVYVYKDGEPFGPSTRILGVDWGHLGGRAGQRPLANAGIVGVVPSWKILELFYQEDVVADRIERGKEMVIPDLDDVRAELDSADGQKQPGPEPERLRLDGSMEDVAKKVMDAGKPEDDAPED